MSSEQIINFLSLLTLVSNIGAAAFIILFLLQKLGIAKKLWKNFNTFLQPNLLKFSFIVAFVATASSLYFSEIAGFEPCKMCWLQRIFMYPLPVILGISIWQKTKDVWRYVLPLSIIGLVLASYHYYMQINPNPMAPCSSIGFSVSCSERFFTHYGYITIPWMSVSAFLLIVIGQILLRNSKVKNRT